MLQKKSLFGEYDLLNAQVLETWSNKNAYYVQKHVKWYKNLPTMINT